MKGIILAGGTGSRLFPMTKTVSKQLLPVYDKPMVYYPLSVLISSGIREILIITTPKDKTSFIDLLGNGSQWGVEISYEAQPEPKGIAQAFVIGESFIKGDKVSLILGDNIFWSETIGQKMEEAAKYEHATIFSYIVSNPEDFGVIEKDAKGVILNIEEKPLNPKSKEVSVGLYVYNDDVSEVAKSLKPSHRLEYEITDINNFYIKQRRLNCLPFNRGSAWLDTGTVSSLMNAAEFVRTVQNRQGILIGSPEEAALNKGFIGRDGIRKIADKMGNSDYALAIRNL